MKTAVAVAILFCCVVSYGQDVAGNYVLRGEMEVGSELTLKQDGHFEFTACDVGEEDEIGMGTTHLLLEHARVEDERRRRA